MTLTSTHSVVTAATGPPVNCCIDDSDDHTSGGCESIFPALVPLVGVVDTLGRSSTGSLGVSHASGSAESRTVAGSIVGVHSNRKPAVLWSCIHIEAVVDLTITFLHSGVWSCDWHVTWSAVGATTSAPPISHASSGTAVGGIPPEVLPGTFHSRGTSSAVSAIAPHISAGGPSVALRIDAA